MRQRVAAKRYSRAIFELSLENGSLSRVSGDMENLMRASSMVPSLVRGLSDERYSSDRRLKAAREVAAALEFSGEVSGLLCLMVERGRASLIPLVAEDFALRMERHENLARAEVSAASGEDARVAAGKIEKILSEALGMKAVCGTSVDEAIIGGFSLKVGDTHYDASLKGKLDRMKERLLQKG